MKNRTALFIPILTLGFSYLLLSYTTETEEYKNNIIDELSIEIPVDVQSIIDNKCISCHNTESDSQKSKMKLNFDKFTNGKYTNSKLISKLGKIKKQLEKDKMPTQKYLKKNPDKKLTNEEKKILIDWSTQQRNILAGE